MTRRTLRAARTLAPRHARRRPLDAPDATTCAEPAPEAVIDRVTGPYVRPPARNEEM